MKFSKTTQMMIDKTKGFIPLFIGVALLMFFGNMSFEKYSYAGLILYCTVIIFIELHQLRHTIIEVSQ